MLKENEINTNARLQNQKIMQQSDIFHQKDNIKKPEYIQKHKENDINRNKTTYNFLSFNAKNAPQPTHKIKDYFTKSNIVLGGEEESKQPLSSRNYDDTFTRHKKGMNTDHISLGNYDGKEYKVIRNKSKEYNPDKYFQKNISALDRKLKQIYGENIIIGQEKNININKNKAIKIKDEFCVHNEYNPIKVSTNNSKQMKYFNLYGEKGIEKMEEKIKFYKDNSNNDSKKYILGEDSLKNKINMLSSNIFNSEPNEKIKNNINGIRRNARNNSASQKFILNSNFSKTFKIKNEDADYRPSKLNWKDSKSSLYFANETDEKIATQTARQRKVKEFYGSNEKYEKFKSEKKNNINDRKIIEKITSEKNPQINSISKIKKIAEGISQLEQKDLNEVFNLKKNHNENITCEVVTSRIKNGSVDLKDIEKIFANNGIHLYGLKEEARPVFGSRNDNKIIFNIRKSENDKNFGTKLKEAKSELKNRKGIVIKSHDQKINKFNGLNTEIENNRKSFGPSQYKIHVNILPKKK